MNPNQALLEQIINDPALLKMLEKMAATAPAHKKEKKLKELGNPSYVNELSIRCKLCGSIHTMYMCMSYDSEDKLYRASARHLDNVWPLLPVYPLIQRQTTCKKCPEILIYLEPAMLVEKLINCAENNIMCAVRN